MSTLVAGEYAIYRHSKTPRGERPVRVKILDVPEQGLKAKVRITSNKHPKYRHGEIISVNKTSLYPYGDNNTTKE